LFFCLLFCFYSYEKLKFRVNLYRLREEREITPEVLSNVCATTLYERRFAPYFVEPVVAGLRVDNTPFLCAMDLLGAPLKTEDFVLAGTCSWQLYGMCESLWRPNLSPDELFEVISQCLLASVDRDALSGWGAVVHVLSPTTLVTRHLKARQD
jgi:20S proteasome subunit beta 3